MGEEAPFTDADLREGGVKLVNYWASWCAPCRAEHRFLEQLQAEGVPIYGINYKDDPDNALAFLDELGNPYAAMGADETGRTAIDWGLYGVPETYVVAADGTIILRFPGPINESIWKAPSDLRWPKRLRASAAFSFRRPPPRPPANPR